MVPPPLLVSIAAGLALAVAPSAAAGGWWSSIDVDRSAVTPGQRVHVAAEVVPPSAAKGEGDADREFFVYLLRGHPDEVVTRAMVKADPGDWWSLAGAEVFTVGRVDLSIGSDGLARARATFAVPDVPAGAYEVMLCDAGCGEPLPDVVPTRLRVVADPATAALLERAELLERRIARHGRLLVSARAAAARARSRARSEARSAESALGDLERRVHALERRLRDRDAVASGSGFPEAGAFAAGSVLALLAILAVLAVRRARRPGRAGAAGRSGSTDAELAEVLSAGGRDRARQSSVK